MPRNILEVVCLGAAGFAAASLFSILYRRYSLCHRSGTTETSRKSACSLGKESGSQLQSGNGDNINRKDYRNNFNDNGMTRQSLAHNNAEGNRNSTDSIDIHLRRKQRDRRRKLCKQNADRRLLAAEGTLASGSPLALAQSAACASIRAWEYIRRRCGFAMRDGLLAAEDRAREDALHAFYDQAYHAGVYEDVVAAAADAYIADKFEGRVDTACRCLLAAQLAGFTVRKGGDCSHTAGNADDNSSTAASSRAYVVKGSSSRSDKSNGGDNRRVCVASVGGGPGNDAVGFAVFNGLSAAPFAAVDMVVYDFCDAWRPLVEQVGAALGSPDANPEEEVARRKIVGHVAEESAQLGNGSSKRYGADRIASATVELSLRFSLADLTASASAEVNAPLLDAAAATDLFLFCYVCHESNAWHHDVLPNLLQRASPGALFLFVDLWRKDLDMIADCV